MDKRHRQILLLLPKGGRLVQLRQGHLACELADGRTLRYPDGRVLTVAASPSDVNAIRNARRDVERCLSRMKDAGEL